MAFGAAGLRFRICALAFGLGLALAALAPASARASVFADWAAVVVAGDWRGANGGPTLAFDNARQDLAKAFSGAGLQARNIRQFSVNPEVGRRGAAALATPEGLYEGLIELAARAPGCIFYLTSHGDPKGALIGDQILPPAILGQMLDRTCGAKPTVVVISACFSGVFLPALAKPNRLVLTAARPDRTSFGCGEADRYPYFDECFLQEMGRSVDFAVLAPRVRTCVAEREGREGVAPPSEPQIWIGPQLRPMLPLMRFSPPPGG
ncbi:MAG TPA: C13 family peptidase [Phenylobacterium sp.]|nr:C13 family peptidase [Phenylobacterium sp.]